MKKSLKQILFFVAFLATVSSFTSCNKGYGCPNNFSIDKTAVKVVKTAAKIMIQE